ncbi:MAG: gliding motility-associated C-terminal domain-containing protein [Bacteroidia bacterium]
MRKDVNLATSYRYNYMLNNTSYSLLIIAVLLLGIIPTQSNGQICDYSISPSTHHNWVNISAQRITDSIGLGHDSMIVRNTKKLIVASEAFNSKQDLVTRSYIKWDMNFDSKNFCEFRNAYLNLNFTGNTLDSHRVDSGANDFYISRIVDPWGKDTLRWSENNIPLIAPYRMPLTTTVGQIRVSGSKIGDEDFRVNIKDIVNYWVNNPGSNYGIEIRLVEESGKRSLTFTNSKFDAVSIRPNIEAEVKSCKYNKAFAGNDVEMCIGDEYQLNAQYNEFFEWTSTAPITNRYIADPITKPTSPGTYEYILKADLGSCSSTDTMQITVYPYPVISVSSDEDICFGDSVTINVNGATNYEWTPNNFINDNTSSSPTVWPTKPTRYDVVADDGNMCTVTDSVKVIVRPLTETDAGDDVKICAGESAQLLATGGITYDWTGNTAGLSATNISNPAASPTQTTTYYVTASNGFCPIEDSVKVTVIPAFTVDAGDDIEICLGDTAYLDGETGFFYYQWTPSALMNNSSIADPYILNLTNSTTVTLHVEDENQCSAEDEVKITVNNPPELYIGSDTFVCVTETVDILIEKLEGVQPYKFEWSPTFGITTDPSAKDITVEGIKDTIVLYELSVEDGNGCISKDDILITSLPGIQAVTFGDTTICNGATAEIGAKGAQFYKWFGDDILGSNLKRTALVKPEKPTTYRVEVSNGEACGDAVGFVDVNVIQLPTAYAHLASSQRENDTVFVCKGREVLLEADGAETYIWSTEDTSETISYRVVVDDVYLTVYGTSKGCVGPIDSILVKIDPTDTCYSNIYIPNAFTPNDDLLNDQFEIHPFLISSFKMSIYNRWGQILFETEDPYDWWDGTYNGKLVSEGAYFYVIDAFGKDEESRSTSGTVQVIY